MFISQMRLWAHGPFGWIGYNVRTRPFLDLTELLRVFNFINKLFCKCLALPAAVNPALLWSRPLVTSLYTVSQKMHQL